MWTSFERLSLHSSPELDLRVNMDGESFQELPAFPNATFVPSTLEAVTNESSSLLNFGRPEEFIFDRTDVRAIFLTLYTIVFCSCFFGNLMVILVVCLHWRMRSITNFCLANLAFADLCVGIFCVYQTIFKYIMDSWIFGDFMCKMHHFVSSLSTTASILILVVICIERYLAIIHPMRCKQMLTRNRLRFTIASVWIVSALISCPRFYYFKTIVIPMDGVDTVLCIPDRTKYNSQIVDMLSMVLLFIIPLMVISILYFRIGVSLWKSSDSTMPSASTSVSVESTSSSCPCESSIEPYPSSPGLQGGQGSSSSPHSFSLLSCFRTKLRSKGKKQGHGKRHATGNNPINGFPGESHNYAALNLHAMNGLPAGRGSLAGGNCCCSCRGRAPPSAPRQSQGNPTCCTCATAKGTESVPVSPYLKRGDSSPLSSPPPNINTEPIVLVKFEKKGSLRKCRRNHCTILMRSTPALSSGESGLNGTGEENSAPAGCQMCEAENGADSSCPYSRGRMGCEKNFDGILKHQNSNFLSTPHPNANGNGHHHHNHNQLSSPAPKGLKRLRVIRSSKTGTRALQCRRRIVRMLIVIVVVFALCHLPFHARKVWQYSGIMYDGGGAFSALFTPVTFLIMYAQSGINPVLYAFMSRKFRSSFADLLCCNMRRSLKISRNLSVRSTNAIQLSQTT